MSECKVVKESTKLGFGLPEQNDGKCEGYTADESGLPIMPCLGCKRCTINQILAEVEKYAQIFYIVQPYDR